MDQKNTGSEHNRQAPQLMGNLVIYFLKATCDTMSGIKSEPVKGEIEPKIFLVPQQKEGILGRYLNNSDFDCKNTNYISFNKISFSMHYVPRP